MEAVFAEAPERVGRYEILLPIAKGGMATVYLARAEGHGGFDRYVALKLTLPSLRSNPEFRAHLIDEAKLVAHLRHTNVVPVLDVGEDALGVFLVMEYVPGDSLSGLAASARAAGAPLPPRVALRALVDALGGLHAAHEHLDEDGHPLHLVHRDFSPQNILVATDGVARLTDFGIAKAASRASITAAGLVKGKMSYVAPEQARGVALDRRCDLWAAGVIAWEIVCGRKLVTPNDLRSLIDTVKVEPPRVRTIVPDTHVALDDAIASVLKLDPDHRTATAAAFARELARAARAANMLAEADEVAEHVKRLAGPELAERKAKLAAARRQRQASDPDGISTVLGLPPPLAAGGATVSGRAAATTSGVIAVPAADEMSIHVFESAPPPPLPLDAPAFPSPPSPSLGIEASTLDVPDAREVPDVRDVGDSVPDVPLHVAPDGVRDLDMRKLGLFAGGVSFLVLALVLIATLTSASRRDEVNAASDAGVPSGKSNGNGAAAATPAAPSASARAAPQAHAPDFGMGRYLELTANAPIAEVTIAGRVVDVGIAAPKVSIELEPDEAEGDLRVVVRSGDGRTATAYLSHDERSATIKFDAPRRAPSRP